jgi:hypothetical protein
MFLRALPESVHRLKEAPTRRRWEKLWCGLLRLASSRSDFDPYYFLAYLLGSYAMILGSYIAPLVVAIESWPLLLHTHHDVASSQASDHLEHFINVSSTSPMLSALLECFGFVTLSDEIRKSPLAALACSCSLWMPPHGLVIPSSWCQCRPCDFLPCIGMLQST